MTPNWRRLITCVSAIALLFGNEEAGARNCFRPRRRCCVQYNTCSPTTSSCCPQDCLGDYILSDKVVTGVDLVEGREVRSKTFTFAERTDKGDCEWRAGETSLTIWEDGRWEASTHMHCNARTIPLSYCVFYFGLRVGGWELFSNRRYPATGSTIAGGGDVRDRPTGQEDFIRANFDNMTYAARRTACSWRH